VVPQFELSLSHITTKAGAELVLFGHLAEGSLHANVLGLEPGDGSIEDDVYRLVLDLGGNPSSEHGVGSTKVRWQHLAMSPLELRVLQGVKRAFDPMGLMSPGVLVPTD
jgi:FAD/FMN-containing dehydrogenase